MANRAATFHQMDITRAVRGARKAGFEPGRVDIGTDGKIILWRAGPDNEDDPSHNPWDKVLDHGRET